MKHLDRRLARHHDVIVRTTLTLDPDVARLLEQEVHRLKQPFKQVVNDALRRGLTGGRRGRALPPFRVEPHRARLLPGVDRGSFNRLADELEEDAVVAKLRRR
jgi:hypothetical protein